MNRRGFLGLIEKLVSVGAAMSVAPALLAPIQKILPPKLTQAQLEILEAQLRELKKDMEKYKTIAVYTLAS